MTHDITRERELDATLRALDAELCRWLGASGPRATVPLELVPPRVEVTHLRERFHDPGEAAAPAPLADLTDGRPDALKLADLLAQGGPSLAALRSALAGAVDDGTLASLGALFESLDPELRRPVEILGLLHLAQNTTDLVAHADQETYRTRRTDGSERRFSTARLAPPGATAGVEDR